MATIPQACTGAAQLADITDGKRGRWSRSPYLHLTISASMTVRSAVATSSIAPAPSTAAPSANSLTSSWSVISSVPLLSDMLSGQSCQRRHQSLCHPTHRN
eukprot:789647-Amphidinium_carterae.1